MNFQDAAREYFKQQLGVTSGSYPEVATAYYLALINGTITPGGPTAIGDVTGLQDALNALSGRITALEGASEG